MDSENLDTVAGIEERWASLSQQLYASWNKNADYWTEAVRGQHIESRRLATDDAMVSALLKYKCQRILDLGCGEGWLARNLAKHDLEAIGIDASKALIEKAQEAAHEYPSGPYYCLNYQELLSNASPIKSQFDAIAANFSLLDQGLEPILTGLHHYVRPAGHLLIQTVHPSVSGPPYSDGWRHESFQAMKASSDAPDWAPMPWYFRTLGSWIQLLHQTQWQLVELQEPVHPELQRPLSVLFIAQSQA